MRHLSQIIRGATLLAAAALAGTAAAQDTTAPPRPLPSTIPGLDTFSLPGTVTRPLPTITGVPRPIVTPTATPRPPRPAASATPASRPTAAATPAPRPGATPRARPTPQPTAAPEAAPSVALPTIAPAPVATPAVLATPEPTSTPMPMPTPTPQPLPAEQGGFPWGWALLAVALAAVGCFGLYRLRRNRAEDMAEEEAEPLDHAPVPAPAPVPASEDAPLDLTQALQPALPDEAPLPDQAPPPSLFRRAAGARAQLVLELEARRAGTNLTSGAVDYLARIRNEGTVAAEAIRLDLKMIGAGAGQDPLIAQLLADPIERSLVAPFTLAAGDAIELTGMALIPREQVRAVPSPAGQSFFVPVVLLNVRYRWGGTRSGEGHTGASFVLGRQKAEGEKLGSFRLDGPPRMWTEVGVLRYPVAVSE